MLARDPRRRVLFPRELLTATSCPARANSRAAAAPMFPEPTTPIFISAPPFQPLFLEHPFQKPAKKI